MATFDYRTLSGGMTKDEYYSQAWSSGAFRNEAELSESYGRYLSWSQLSAGDQKSELEYEQWRSDTGLEGAQAFDVKSTYLGTGISQARRAYEEKRASVIASSGSRVADPRKAAEKFRQSLLGSSIDSGSTLLGA